jgi:hypothetical protein
MNSDALPKILARHDSASISRIMVTYLTLISQEGGLERCGRCHAPSTNLGLRVRLSGGVREVRLGTTTAAFGGNLGLCCARLDGRIGSKIKRCADSGSAFWWTLRCGRCDLLERR